MTGGDWGRRTRRGIIWSNVAFVAARAVSSVSLLVLGRLLTPSEFGVVAAIAAYSFFLELVSDVGMRATVVYEQEEGVTERVQSAFTLNLLLALGLSAVSFALAPEVAAFFHAEEHADLFRLAAANPVLKGLGNIHDGLLLRAMAFRKRLVPEVADAITRAAVSVPLAALGAGALALVAGLLAGTFAWTASLWLLTRFRPTFRLDLGIVRSMAAYGTAASLVDIVAAAAARVDVVVIGRLLGERALGLYTVAFRVPELLIESVAWNTALVAFPALSRRRRDDPEALPDSTRQLIRYQALYALPLSAWLAVVGGPLMVTLFGAAWTQAGGVASAIAVFAGLTAVVFPMGDVFKALGRQRIFLLLQAVQIPLAIAVIVLVAPAGIVAVAWARTGSRAVFSAVLTVVVSRTLGTPARRFVSAVGPAAAASAGVIIGAGAVRMAWPDLSVGPLLAETAAAAAGGSVTLFLFARPAFREVSAAASRLLAPPLRKAASFWAG